MKVKFKYVFILLFITFVFMTTILVYNITKDPEINYDRKIDNDLTVKIEQLMESHKYLTDSVWSDSNISPKAKVNIFSLISKKIRVTLIEENRITITLEYLINQKPYSKEVYGVFEKKEGKWTPMFNEYGNLF